MIKLVRCPDQTVSVALESRLQALIADGSITAYLDTDGWVAVAGQKSLARTYRLLAPKPCPPRPPNCL